MVEAAVWPSWSKPPVRAQAVGLLLLTKGDQLSGIFAGVTNNGSVVIESWANGVPTTIKSYDLSLNPGNQATEAVDGWNMLRLRKVEQSVQVWFNPTHADVALPPASRGLRVEADHHDTALTGEVAAAARGGAGLQVDYAGFFACGAANLSLAC